MSPEVLIKHKAVFNMSACGHWLLLHCNCFNGYQHLTHTEPESMWIFTP